MGDPAGVGPETIAGAWQHAHLHRRCRLIVVGHPQIMQRALELRGATTEVVPVERVGRAESSVDCLPCLAAVSDEAVDVPSGRIDPRAGQAAYQALVTAARLALENRIDALVTAPLNKAALHAAGHAYPGHTELLAELCGVKRFAMMLYLRDPQRIAGPSGLGIAHVTLHMALRNVFAHLHPEAVLEKIRLCHTVMRTIRAGDGAEKVEWSQEPRIAVCALNPHGGEMDCSATKSNA
jgi:4-phospho-D-threonate 3-dehydrogenase / 4-phospho-D-erythronate 3-dehydrogenase